MTDVHGSLERETPRRDSARVAVSYVRVSGLGQVEGDGLDRQRRKIADYAKRNRLQVVAEFSDPGVSGATVAEHREGFSKLLDHVRGGRVQVVLIENMSRLSRDLLVSEVALRTLADLDVQVIAAEDGTDLGEDDSPTRVMVRQILGAVAQFERSMVVARLRASRDKIRRERGRCEGPKPLGATGDEQRAIERVLQLRRKRRGHKRMSYARIAKQLDAEGYRPRNSERWSASTVARIVQRHAPRQRAAS